MMFCKNSKVFATSEPLSEYSGYETNIHQFALMPSPFSLFLTTIKHYTIRSTMLIESLNRSGNLLPAASKPTTSATPATSTP